MHRSVKAAVLSGLVFPGAGQLFLKRPLRALVFMVPALLAAIYFSSAVLDPLLAIAHEITSGTMAFDSFLIQQRVEQSRIDTGMMNIAALVMLLAWIASTIDAWMLGCSAPPVAPK
ncbi:MAG: hypothetical protein WKG03_22650 [Telluria sp.]